VLADYEPFGYYTIPKEQYYTVPQERRATASGDGPLHDAAQHAASELNLFNAIRTAPFRGGAFERALLARCESAAAVAEPAGRKVTESSLIFRFGRAVARVQDASATEPVATFLSEAGLGVKLGSVAEDGGGRMSDVGDGGELSCLVRAHVRAIDAELLSAPNLGAMVGLLHERNRAADHGPGQRAGALMMALLYAFYATWMPGRTLPLKRKDFFPDGKMTAVRVDALQRPGYPAGGQITVERVCWKPIIRAAYFLCSESDENSAGECQLPWM